jgi:hypothetical protein
VFFANFAIYLPHFGPWSKELISVTVLPLMKKTALLRAADALGLRGEVKGEDWQQVIEGLDHRTGEQLVQAGANSKHRSVNGLRSRPTGEKKRRLI